MSARSVRVLVALTSLAIALGCTARFGGSSPVASQARPALAEAGAIRSIAVVPFQVGEPLLSRAAPPGAARPAPPVEPSVAARKAARFLAEALAARGIEVVAADDVERALALEESPPAPLAVARIARHEFGADAVLAGRVTRWRERSGEAIGTLQPAAVAFEVTLHAAPSGASLWTGYFDETQKALSENVLRASQYPGGGSRWLTADELARWGAGELVKKIPLE